MSKAAEAALQEVSGAKAAVEALDAARPNLLNHNFWTSQDPAVCRRSEWQSSKPWTATAKRLADALSGS